jgi:hypothetical protein
VDRVDNSDDGVSCSLHTNTNSVSKNEEFTLTWTTDGADTVTLNGNSVLIDGTLITSINGDTTYTLVASNEGTGKSTTCSLDIDVPSNGGGGGGGSSNRKSTSSSGGNVLGAFDSEPLGEVLGEATSVLPVGAPNTGAGGAAPSPVASLVALFGMLMSLVTLRVTKNA